MIYDNGMQFSSYDRDNDAKSGKNLASNSGWWFRTWGPAILTGNGKYYRWWHSLGWGPLKSSYMMVRRVGPWRLLLYDPGDRAARKKYKCSSASREDFDESGLVILEIIYMYISY